MYVCMKRYVHYTYVYIITNIKPMRVYSYIHVYVCCSVLQCAVVYPSLLQCVAVCYSVLQRVAQCIAVLQFAVRSSVSQCVLQCVLHCVAMCHGAL